VREAKYFSNDYCNLKMITTFGYKKKNPMKSCLLFFSFYLLFLLNAKSQQSINTKGKEIYDNGGNVSYSIGQPIIANNNTSSRSIIRRSTTYIQFAACIFKKRK
jgi:hypothetical protein